MRSLNPTTPALPIGVFRRFRAAASVQSVTSPNKLNLVCAKLANAPERETNGNRMKGEFPVLMPVFEQAPAGDYRRQGIFPWICRKLLSSGLTRSIIVLGVFACQLWRRLLEYKENEFYRINWDDVETFQSQFSAPYPGFFQTVFSWECCDFVAFSGVSALILERIDAFQQPGVFLNPVKTAKILRFLHLRKYRFNILRIFPFNFTAWP